MASFNKVFLMGNLTRDPELRYTPKGTAVTDVGMAVNRVFNSGDGQRQEETTFVDVTFWGRTAETVCKFLSKGRPLFVEGRLKFDSWEKDGQKRSKLSVNGENFQFIDSRKDSGDSPDGGGGYNSKAEAPQAPHSEYEFQGESTGGGGGDDEVPF
ncbi:MAG: single-stranded DNA-binding protein [Planctomycetota bacterium]|nr:single-stranded DNA-binding protein [Planctomycetota bacterium]